MPILPSLDRSDRLLVVPAAGIGSRLKSSSPKFLVPVLGRPMIDWLVDLCRPFAGRLALVVSPATADVARRRAWPADLEVTVCTQAAPTGMLDAVMLASDVVERSPAQRIWVLWCDQIALAAATIARLSELDDTRSDAGLIMPTCLRAAPYIHFARDETRRIVAVRQRREGDQMPAEGESDAGCFSFSRDAFLRDLPEYGSVVAPGTGTGERNLLPFIPWLAARRAVITFPCQSEIEAVGINTPEELRVVEQALAGRHP